MIDKACLVRGLNVGEAGLADHETNSSFPSALARGIGAGSDLGFTRVGVADIELRDLRAKVRRLEAENEILRRAAAFFAKASSHQRFPEFGYRLISDELRAGGGRSPSRGFSAYVKRSGSRR